MAPPTAAKLTPPATPTRAERWANPAPAPGFGAATNFLKDAGNDFSSWAASTLNGALHPPGRQGSVINPAPAPGVGIHESHGAAPPRADALNASYDQQGYGPHSTEAQVDAARGQRNANQANDRPYQPPGVTTTPGTAPTIAPAASRGVGVGSARSAGSPPPATFREYLKQTGDKGAVARYDKMDIEGGDPYRGMLMEKMSNPGMSREGGIGVYRAPDMGSEDTYDEHGKSNHDGRPMQTVRQRNDLNRVTAQNQLAAYDASAAHVRSLDGQVRNGDSIGQLAALAKMGPRAHALFLAGQGHDPNLARNLPGGGTPGQSPYNASNFQNAGQTNQALAEPAAVLSGSMPFHEQVAHFASYPGIENPGSPERQLFDAFMSKKQANGSAYHDEMSQYNPMSLGHENAYDTSNPWRAALAIGQAAYDGLTGEGGRKTLRNQTLANNLGILGYGPSQIGVPNPVNQVFQGIGVKRPPTEE